MALPTTERLSRHCGAHTAEPKIGDITPTPVCRNAAVFCGLHVLGVLVGNKLDLDTRVEVKTAQGAQATR